MDKSSKFNGKIAEYRKKFYSMYHSSIVPIFQQYEYERKNRLLTLSIILLIVLAAGIFAGASFTLNYGFMEVIAPIIIFVCIVLLIYLPIHYNDKFVDELKKHCMSKVLKVFGDVKWFDKSNLISDFELKESDLFANYNRRVAKDAFSGEYNGVPFKICETYLYHESGSGKNRRVINVFNGVVIKFASNKKILNKTIVATRGDMMLKRQNFFVLTSFSLIPFVIIDYISSGFNLSEIIQWSVIIAFFCVGYLVYRLLDKSKEEVLNEIKLEDPEFTKKYVAYSSDQVEGRYLITTAFMERFKNIETSFGTNKVKCSFYDDNLMFAISTNKNLFEIGNLFYSLNNPKQMEAFFNELTSLFALVDYFKLNEKTGL